MKEIRTLLAPQMLYSFDLYGVAPPAVRTHEETYDLQLRDKRRRKPYRVSARFQSIRNMAETHLRARRATA